MDHITSAPAILRDFLTYMETISGKSRRTVEEYYFDLRTFFRFLQMKKDFPDIRSKASDEEYFEAISIDGISLQDLNNVDLGTLYEYMNFLAQYRGLSASSRARKTSSLRSYYKYLTTRAHLIENNPTAALDTPKQKKSLPRYLTLSESEHLLQSIQGPDRERDYAIITLFLNCGMRLSELVSIDIPDIREDRITITGKGNKERTIYLNDACLAAIQQYLQVRPVDGVKDKNALFLSRLKKRISVKTVQWLVKKYLGEAGLNPQKFSVHKLRHTAATLMYQHGGADLRSLQEILGHEQLSTTQIYTHISEERLREASASNPLNQVRMEPQDPPSDTALSPTPPTDRAKKQR
ncbi:MAG: tyrosine recombinase XerC [Eubacteriales bacterium]|jgi:integrase/recombinase XerD